MRLFRWLVLAALLVCCITLPVACTESSAATPEPAESAPSSPSSRRPSSRAISSGETASALALTAAPPPGELRGLWVTYFEIGNLFDAPEGFRAAWDALLEKSAAMGINALFVHVRSHCDAYYPSEIFPWSKYCTGIVGTQGVDPGFDPLDYAVTAAHKKGIAFHAWINPYRVLFDSQELTRLSDDNPAKIWLTDDDPDNDTYVRPAGEGLYLNPAVQEVQGLVADGVREIVSRYPVDGVHFDDYFYPTEDEGFDEREYAAYRAAVWDDPLPLDDWRRANVTAMIARSCEAVHNTRPGCVFGIGPMAGIEGNFSKVFADVAGWVEAGVVDYLMPQLYFGFDFGIDAYRFDTLLTRWRDLTRESDVALYAGLAAYRIGTDEAGHEEWTERHDILARQADRGRAAGCAGYCIYSYSALFADDDAHAAERENLLKLIP